MRPIELTSVCDRLTDSADSEDNFNYLSLHTHKQYYGKKVIIHSLKYVSN